MEYLNVVNGPQNVSRIILGCMRMPALDVQAAAKMIARSVEMGVNFFDHATIYGRGEAEKRFGDALPLSGVKREDIFIQSKCGIHPERKEFDWRKDDILQCVDESLERLKTDYLDALLLHRPDLLFDPYEVSEAFDELYKAGKVKHFGVSNVTPGQLELLKKFAKRPLVFNQLQFSLDQTQLIDGGIYQDNMTTERSALRDAGILDYCRLNDITIQAWSPLQVGMFQGTFVDNPDYPELNAVLGKLAEKYSVSKAGIAIAWILKHPAKIQAIAGTMNPDHLKDICDAANIEITHNEWYELYQASGKFLP